MQLRDLIFWKQHDVGSGNGTKDQSTETEQTSNVISMLPETPIDSSIGLSDPPPIYDPSYITIKTKPIPKGPMAAKELTEFFSKNFINCGRYAGATQRTQEAREYGLAALISEFQNIIETVIDEKRSKVDYLRHVAAQTNGASDIVSTQLHLSQEKLQRDILILKEQFDLSVDKKGWILSAINEFRIGFDRGLRDAVDAELLGI